MERQGELKTKREFNNQQKENATLTKRSKKMRMKNKRVALRRKNKRVALRRKGEKSTTLRRIKGNKMVALKRTKRKKKSVLIRKETSLKKHRGMHLQISNIRRSIALKQKRNKVKRGKLTLLNSSEKTKTNSNILIDRCRYKTQARKKSQQ